jgi:hypothetical protein
MRKSERLLDAGEAPAFHHGAELLEAGKMGADFGEQVHGRALRKRDEAGL